MRRYIAFSVAGFIAAISGLLQNEAQVVCAEPASAQTPLDRAGNRDQKEWPQFGRTSYRNNVGKGRGIPTTWDVATKANIKWSAKLGSQTNGSPVVASGKVFIGTNNAAGYVKRYPSEVDLGCLLCFDQSTGNFLWQHFCEKLRTGRVHDWPLQGICSTPLVVGDRVWCVTNRCEVICLDAEGFHDDENDGPFIDEINQTKGESDLIWSFDMMSLGVSPRHQSSCSITCAGRVLLVGTSNGVDEGRLQPPAPEAPSFIAIDRETGRLLWTDNSPGTNILHGQWSSPASGVLGGVPQVIFAGGDGWLYSFELQSMRRGKTTLLWRFDCNPKQSRYELGGLGTRNNLIASPAIYGGLVYIAVGQDPEHGEGPGHLWCIDPTKRGDISPELVYNKRDPETPIPHKRTQACVPAEGDFVRRNVNSCVVWEYHEFDLNGDGKIAFEEAMHRACGSVAIANDLLFVADLSGLCHCLNAKTGVPCWTHDLLAACWSTPLIVDKKVYIGDEDGDVTIFKLSTKKEILSRDKDGESNPINIGNSVYGTPVVANNVLFIANKNTLFAIESKKE